MGKTLRVLAVIALVATAVLLFNLLIQTAPGVSPWSSRNFTAMSDQALDDEMITPQWMLALDELIRRAKDGDQTALFILRKQARQHAHLRFVILELSFRKGVLSDAEWVPLAVDYLKDKTEHNLGERSKQVVLFALESIRGAPFSDGCQAPKSDDEWRQIASSVMEWYERDRNVLSTTPHERDIDPPW